MPSYSWVVTAIANTTSPLLSMTSKGSLVRAPCVPFFVAKAFVFVVVVVIVIMY